MTQVLQYSLNTGVVHLFKQLGGGEFNKQGREKLHDYLVGKYRFNAETGVELAGEAPGDIADATTGDGDNVRYANMSFGQGMTVTMLQVSAGLNAIINGGTYYKPTVQDKSAGQAVARNIVKPQVSSDLRDMMRAVIKGSPFDKPGYYVGGKSGTAQLLDANGNYTDSKTTGSYLGFIGSTQPEYVIMVRVDEPDSTQGFSGTTAAAPLFSSICDYVIQYYAMAPAS
jgi:cell division protein FtsI/penicillin-binding protein 2